ncbi:MAG: hypothetical protein HY818_18055 [Acetobacterium woodii]|nr:hypothetical protein [Acetobacterium woodii]
MFPIKNYQFAPSSNEPFRFSRGFSLAVVVILLFATLIIGGLILNIQNTTYAANARLVYLAAQAKAIEFEASGHYHVPVQSDLIDLIGAEVNRDAVITVVDENQDTAIDYIVYTRGGLVTRYSPGELVAGEER